MKATTYTNATTGLMTVSAITGQVAARTKRPQLAGVLAMTCITTYLAAGVLTCVALYQIFSGKMEF